MILTSSSAGANRLDPSLYDDLQSGGPGICHFPRRFWKDSEKRHFFAQLVAPKARHKVVNGEWRTIYETTQGTPDHAFDCYRYTLVVFYWLGTDIDQRADYLERKVRDANA